MASQLAAFKLTTFWTFAVPCVDDHGDDPNYLMCADQPFLQAVDTLVDRRMDAVIQAGCRGFCTASIPAV